MKFPSLPFLKKKNPYSYFLVLVLRNEKASAVVFEELAGKITVIGQHAEYFKNSVEEASMDEMLEVLDKAISTAEDAMPDNIETEKTIFGVKEAWVENDKIKKEYLTKLKKVSDELGLTPIGFLIISQAITHLLQKEEGAPVSAILVELGDRYVTVSLIRAGRIIETKISQIHESVPYTVDTVLKHFQTSEILPSRIILFDGEKDLSQEFLAHAWSKSLPFLHLPQIATLPVNFDARSVLFGAATQMGFEVLEEPIKKDTPQEISEKPTEELATKKEEKEEINPQEDYLTLEEIGFINDIASSVSHSGKPKAHPESDSQVPHLPQNDVTLQTKIIHVITPLKNILIRILHFVKKSLSKIQLPFGRSKTFVIPALAAIALICLFIFYLFGTKTKIVLNIKPRVIEQSKNITFSTLATTDTSKLIINGQTVTVSVEGSNSTPSTGKKEIGNKALGKVTIFNSLTQNKTLPSGTTIKSTNGLSFTLDDSITIKAVASHSADETVSPSTTTAGVSAVQIGKESNLPSGTKFTVASFDSSDLVAKNDAPFSGGTKKEVTVVSKKDVDKLTDELPKILEEKAKEEIKKQSSEDKALLGIFTKKAISRKKLDKDVGEETDKVNLNATVDFQSLSYKKDDLNKLSASLIKYSASSTLIINNGNVKIDIKDLEQKDKTITANLHVKALLQPRIDEKILKEDLAGKSYKDAKDKLSKIPQVSDITISSSPSIPLLPKIITKTAKNIKIEISINE